MDEIDNEATSQTTAPTSSIRLKWFPILWIGTPVAVALTIKALEGDPGLTNSILHVTVVLGALGLTWWMFRCTNLSRKICLLFGVVPSVLLVAQYAQLTPIEMVLDGDVGLVGFRSRWHTPDKNLSKPEAVTEPSIDWQSSPNDYPRFLGNGYWAEVADVQLETDWQARPPRKLWQKKIGAGWSAFAIVGNYAFTQEQRGDNELVTCYDVKTGDILWSHSDPVRWDPGGAGSLGYSGPRATPTVHGDKVFAQGATGILNCLEARTGKVVWSHDTLAKHDATNVLWGKSCSPLIIDDMVIVSVGGMQNQSVVAYDVESGEVRWASGEYQSSYASPIVAEIGGVRQVVTVDENFATARRADNGEPIWEFPWPSSSGGEAAVSQPIPLPGDRLFLSKGYGVGSTLLQITNDEGDDWQLDPVWSGGIKTVLKTKFGNVVLRDGYVYGIDDVNLQCVELETGKKQWKKRRRPNFGHGQIMLIGDAILVLSEGGEVILVEASPQKYRELASMRVFDDSQITWNNPAFAAPYLLVRNAEEAACYELPIKETVEVAKVN
ncbi:MAG: PQQ-binding-like beta-propeller repeat protein [Planctomycetota bacterium]